jgi:hypothetical protein
VNYYYVRLKQIRLQKRLTHLPEELPFWIENVVNIVKIKIDYEIKLMQNQNQNFDENQSTDGIKNTNNYKKNEYINELLYGLNLIVCHLKMILNHHRLLQVPFTNMESIFIEKFFRLTNNMCTIMIVFKSIDLVYI